MLKKILSLTLSLLFFSQILSFPSIARTSQSAIFITLNSDVYQIVRQNDGYDKVDMKGFSNLGNPGQPVLPHKLERIALPPGTIYDGLEIVEVNEKTISGNYKILPAKSLLSTYPGGNEGLKYNEKDERIYSSDNPFPDKKIKYLSQGKMRKWNIINLDFYPLTYLPKSGRIKEAKSLTLKINYQGNKPISSAEISDTVMDEEASRLIKNYAQASQWYRPSGAGLPSSPVVYDYVIITTSGLVGAVAPLKNYRQSQGFKVNVVSVSSITNSGRDTAEKIRNFLKANYLNWKIKHVLLVGSINTIPMRYCSPNPQDHDPPPGSSERTSTTPTDYYYSDLTGDWDSNGNGWWGEYGQDEVDFYPEVYPGKIPFDDATTVTAICNKIVSFSQDYSSWKRSALLLGGIMNYENEDKHSPPWPITDGANLMERIKGDIYVPGGISSFRMYEKSGLAPSAYSCEMPISTANVLSKWTTTDYGIVNWFCHGDKIKAYRKIWSTDDGDHTPEAAKEISWTYFISAADTPQLTRKPSIVYANACINGYPEQTNLGSELLKTGSAGVITSSRISYYSVGWANQNDGGIASINYYFFNSLVNQGQPLGVALRNADLYNIPAGSGGDAWKIQQNLFDYNLYGDPAMILDKDTTPPTGSVSINNGVENIHSTNVTLNISAQDNVRVEQMIVSNNISFSGRSWETFDNTKNWTVPAGDGIKTVYIKFKDKANNISQVYSGSANLQTTKAMERLSGDDRYLTSVAISREGWEKSRIIIMARGDLYPDALAGSPMAAKYSAPILLTNPRSLMSSTRDEILRLQSDKVIILGSEDAISNDVVTDIRLQTGIVDTLRIGGSDRYETVALIAKNLESPVNNTAVIATGENYPDALAVSSLAYTLGMPIFLVKGESIDPSTQDALKVLGIKNILIVGGPDVVGTGFENWFKSQNYTPSRLFGEDRYETARAVADYSLTHGLSADYILITTGENFPDAVSSGPLGGKKKSPLLLVRETFIPSSINDFINRNNSNIWNIYINGGFDVIPQSIQTEIGELVGM